MPELTFGIEIEFNTNLSDTQVADRLTRLGVPTGTVSRLNVPTDGRWAVKHDGSIGRGWEVVSPILTGEAGFAQTKLVCDILAGIPDSHASSSCGLHVHVGGFEDEAMKIRALRNVSRRFVNYEDAMDSIHIESRRGNTNTYCRSNYRQFGRNLGEATRIMWERMDQAVNNNRYGNGIENLVHVVSPQRYLKLNAQSLLRHGTMEFRQHHGTIDAQTVTNWARFVTGFVAQSIAQEDVDRRPARRPRDERFRKMLNGVDLVTQANMWTRRSVMALSPEREAEIRREISEGAQYTFDASTRSFARSSPPVAQPESVAA